jgi:hypothetical protein
VEKKLNQRDPGRKNNELQKKKVCAKNEGPEEKKNYLTK